MLLHQKFLKYLITVQVMIAQRCKSSFIRTMQVLIAIALLMLGTATGTFFLFPHHDAVEDSDDVLVLLHVLFRHGSRIIDPGQTYPTDPYINETYSPFGFSQLTKKGKETELQIGKYLRSTFIPKQYTKNVAYSVCTDTKRTKMSLGLILAGLFPPQDSDKISNLNWDPISFNIESAQGVIAPATVYCPAFVHKYLSYLFSDPAQTAIASHYHLYADLAKYTGAEINSPKEAGVIYFTLKSQEDFGLKLPAWSSKVYPAALEEATSLDYEFSGATPILKKLSAGFLLKKIIEDTRAKINGTLNQDRKIFLYSAHEFNVATMLNLLQAWYRHVPPFGANIIFEVRKIKGEYGFKIYYQDYKATNNNPTLLTIPGCGTFCKIDDFYEIVKEGLPGPTDTCIPSGEVI